MLSDVFGLIGTTIKDQYRIDTVIGEGGFGIVYQGFHLSFEHPVAIKCLKVPAHFTINAKQLFFDKFREEGKLLSKLSNHPSIVRVFDFGVSKTTSGFEVPYLVLEWLNGRELGQMVRERGAFSEAEAIELLSPVVDAIAMAHSMGIAHRDLKPANLFVANTPRGTVIKVLDFGIAKAMQEGESATQITINTSSGFHAFSPQYGAPEQFRPKKFGPTGPWTDVHALALLLVELVTGESALAGEERADFLIAATAPERPTPRAKGITVGDAFERLCSKALSLAPSDRYESAVAMLAALRGVSRSGAPVFTDNCVAVSQNTGGTVMAATPPVALGTIMATSGTVAVNPATAVRPQVPLLVHPHGPSLKLVHGLDTRARLDFGSGLSGESRPGTFGNHGGGGSGNEVRSAIGIGHAATEQLQPELTPTWLDAFSEKVGGACFPRPGKALIAFMVGLAVI